MCSWQWKTMVDFCAPAVGGGGLGETVSSLGCQGQIQLPFLFHTVSCFFFVRADVRGVLSVHLSCIKNEPCLAFTPEPGGPSRPCGRVPNVILGDDVQSRVPGFSFPSVQTPLHQLCSMSVVVDMYSSPSSPDQASDDMVIIFFVSTIASASFVQPRPHSFTSVSRRRPHNHVLSEGGASHQRKYLIHLMFHV